MSDQVLGARPETFGEQLVGLSFNPAGDPKQLCAELADLINEEMHSSNPLKRMLYEHTVGEILNAQMNVVKVLTLKY